MPNNRLAGKNVLVVEDEALVAMMIVEMLSDFSCASVQHADNPDDVQAILKQAPPDVAIVDLNLGGTKSLDLAEKFRELEIPFVFATGYARDGLPAEWQNQPIVNKPFSSATLASAMNAALARQA